jgi:hypothetical protein
MRREFADHERMDQYLILVEQVSQQFIAGAQVVNPN